ncbi:hypothetical protein A3J77_02175 [Candidatus Wolfebacteria bacterium RBG_13_41_7]|uniref:Uncharacterized protein n=1 Tax=Candidatus Wolfebacteria bacterium RBG_13_41_7 TaxID=1802554 RepID=A0A1F8DL62_9BACT|nr:MAG: hypothetical protein A3J77_02175 [Candidatus Wolfebacteria bacterium RBG_13_41_7]
MKIFVSRTFTWWQVGIIKLALLSMGAAIGAYWYEFFGANLGILIAIAIITSVYLIYTSFKNEDKSTSQGQSM